MDRNLQIDARVQETCFHGRHINPQIFAGLTSADDWSIEKYEARGGYQALRRILLGADGKPPMTPEEVIAEVEAAEGVSLKIPIGTMIELPRAAVTADEIATQADFFSFGTNDLTQTTFGFSRDDVEAEFVPQYLSEKLLPYNPFATVDPGVAKLVEMGVTLGHEGNPDLVCGVCGEHGGDPDSVKTFHALGLDYVSCSPYRVPLARLAAAQAAIADME